MSNESYRTILEEVLKRDERLWNEDKTEFSRPLFFDLIDKMDETLIGLLLKDERTREKFFVNVNGVYVFKSNEFRFFIEENTVFNSYTDYANRIGLHNGKEFINDKEEVVLSFPFKDCILQGGQTKEEGIDTYYEYDEKVTKTQERQGWKAGAYNKKKDTRQEIFFNEVLAQDEIDRLLDEKAFVNWKRYTKDGEQEVEEIRRDSNGVIRENLIIKGNNLLALHSLESQFAGKVKLIYIDPPYNTGNDSFRYNDEFNHSTWLTFMKNRFEIAKRLLASDGVIFVQCDDNEQAYLKVLMDEIFGTENFVNCIAVKMSEATGVKMSHANLRFPKIKEYLLFYKMPNFNGFVTIDKYRSNKWDTENNLFLENFTEEDRKKLVKIEDKESISNDDLETVNEILKKAKVKSLSRKIDELGLADNEVESWLFENSFRVFKTAGSTSLANRINSLNKIPNQDIAANISREGVLFYYITDFNREVRDPRLRVIFADSNIYKNPCDFWQDIKTTGGIANEGGVRLLNGKKPERLLYRIIKMTTREGDLVLDFFLGSGTTAAVAHKTNRQYIGIEQLEYGENSSIVRLNNIINGDNTGISRHEDVNWKGGGEFIYFELAEWNEKAKQMIIDCESLDELKSLFDILCQEYFLDYNLKVNEFRNKVVEEDKFKALSLEEQKRMFLTMLDLNQLYVQKSEMADERFGISEEDQRLTRMFYGEE